MNKEQLIERVSTKTGLSKKDVNSTLDALLEGVTAALKKNDKVTLVGFGTFSVRKRAAREGRNPQTGAKLRIPARKVPAFAAGKELKTAVK